MSVPQTKTKSAAIREQVGHPVIDADGHWLEVHPVFLEYVREFVSAKETEQFQREYGDRIARWYRATPEERQHSRLRRPTFWGVPTRTADRAAGTIPSLFRERMDEWGIDVSLLYPSMGFTIARDMPNKADLMSGLVRAYNAMVADIFKPHGSRLLAAGLVNLSEPKEAIAQLEHARSLGLKLVTVGGSIPRTFEVDAEWQPDPNKRRVYIDGLGLDSPHDYDPVWQKFVDFNMPVVSHLGSIGWPDRSSPSNFVYNHIGHFGQAHHTFARSLFLGGVTQRFPSLNFAFLEGGVGWGCNLYSDLFGHWEKRNRKFMLENLKPTNLDRSEMRRLLEKYSDQDPCFKGKIDDIVDRNLDTLEPAVSLEALAERDLGATLDDFRNVKIEDKKDIRRLYANNFYFGCEADDPMTAVAFDSKLRLKLKPMLGSDISHFDVVDPAEVVEEAWELVEHGLISEQNFREFTFTNAVQCYGGMDKDFFKGTIIEDAAATELPLAQARDFSKP